MNEAITNAVMEIAIAVVGLVVAAVVGYVGRAVKRALDSEEVRRYSEALKNFDEDLYASLTDLGVAVEEKIRDDATSFTEGDRYHLIRKSIIREANNFARKSGVNAEFNEEKIDALTRAAIREGGRAWEKAHRNRPPA